MELSKKLNNINTYPFHMPGHKRNSQFTIDASEIDITEIEGFDNLHNPKGIIKSIEDDIAALFCSKRSIISVNGSSCCILAAICAVCDKGDEIIIARNCHKSVYNACFLKELKVNYIEPEFDENLGIFTKVTQHSVDTALNAHPNAKAVVITSPTYEGIVSEINAPVTVIVDSAHGSHFGFADYLPNRAGGDIFINSLHKTLPCLTQCAAIHINNEKYADNIKKYMDIFETSSPSYVLMSSIDKCVDFLKNSKKAFCDYKLLLDDFYDRISELDNIKIFKNDDITRLIISADGYSGAELAKWLRTHNIEAEGFGINYVILISTVCDTKKGFDMLFNALCSLENRSDKAFTLGKPDIPEKIFEQFEVKETVETKLTDAVGKICGESIFAYPPDIPLIAIGEKIDESTVKYINTLIDMGINILSDSDLIPKYILTKRC